ncbi:MAG TPA: glycoside hydrolase [Candidatus Moranbacteria bacterium]|nr:glycoside hydrolase [Candidatus Moranbacteria bacterium]
MLNKKVSTTGLIFLAMIVLLIFGWTKMPKQEKLERKAEFSLPGFTDQVVLPEFPEKICDIRDYGAVEGTEEKSTRAINNAIVDCHQKGGGTVIIPAGQWLSGAINLKSNIDLHLEDGSEIIFSTDLNDYLPVVFTRFQGMEFYNFSPLIYAKDSHDIAITGKGKLIGSGEFRDDWTGEGNFQTARKNLYAMVREGISPEERLFGDNEPGLRPSFIQFVNSKDILLDGFTVENGPIWTIHPVYVENFVARNLTIDTWSGNTDGIVIDSSKNVIIENCDISTGDDAIVIKSGLEEDGWRVARPSENILIRNITVIKGHGGVSIGSEMSGGVRNVYIYDSSFKNTRHGFRIKSTKSRGGFVENIRVSNIEMVNISSDAIDINFSYSSPLRTNISNKPDLKNIYIGNIYGSDIKKAVIKIDGLTNSVMENLTFENITFSSAYKAINFKNARNATLKNIRVVASQNPVFEIENGKNIRIEGSGCTGNIETCISFKGAKTQNIFLKGFDFAGKAVEKTGKISQEAIVIENPINEI